ncbi:hypothetical protein [Heyndrickxia ginsengihumi]|uniref:Uncharacterized protein n=1 Tax=Heyndrickxia ginsengihumi TaxID=363870 RepID=A0A0A6VE54_9BACI|nr:hypothetical protein [Heyndrickxia ginsengihumi]KHD85851.1 hypothetical protein NG54_06815 [Heyndrickxia ginsengihumi]MBE6185699.1 hypothetical protein [Bacillus sp. (in: firmicutes)]MCM3023977.1 hypothetical protein [Heyndrickxia ginsengihumi]NEY21239.1 hypothetical protein [Heyndrickxia ginsengihumi]
MSRYHSMCRRGIGRAVEIRTINGRIHRGIIERVTPNRVFLRPLGRPNLGGYGYGYYGGGYGWGVGWGFGWGVALGAIAALAFIPFFF